MRKDLQAVYTAADYVKENERLRKEFLKFGDFDKNALYLRNIENQAVYFWETAYNKPVAAYGYLLAVTDGKKYGFVSLITLCVVRAGFDTMRELLEDEGIAA